MYGTLNAAILAYKKLKGHLADMGFKMNPYDPCVWNMEVEKHQLSVIFHVDDGFVSHKNPTVVTDFLRKLEKIYMGRLIH